MNISAAASFSRIRIFLAIFLLLLAISVNFTPAVYAQSNEQDTQIKNLEMRLAQIEANQKKILEKQDEILKQLDTLRIWVRRN
ncbi:MAG: hypothetical protein HYZ84_03105 [Candidatus Omnitrophica bacterium]|nr:hypothetical protein [Candidatus Omnitrophota bacterium]